MSGSRREMPPTEPGSLSHVAPAEHNRPIVEPDLGAVDQLSDQVVRESSAEIVLVAGKLTASTQARISVFPSTG